MANPNAPHGMQPVGYTNGAPWTGKANLYHIQSTDTLAYYLGDIMQVVPSAGANSSTHGSDALGVPNATGFAAGAVTAYAPFIGPIVGIQVAPIGVGVPGGTMNSSVNLNVSYIPATKANDYYVWVADDYNLEFEIQGDNTTTLTAATTISENAGFTVAAPAATFGPVSGTVLTTGSLAVTQTLPLKVVRLPYRPNVDFTAYTPFIVRWNMHFFSAPTGTLGV
jgi:hypothetical protein